MALTFRQSKGSALTIAELDSNFSYFTGSYTNTGTITAAGFSGPLTGTASYATTASYLLGSVQSAIVANSVNSLIQDVTITGSILISGSIVPNIPAGSTTSSFSLGSPTAAWKHIYVSNGTIYFTNGAGTTQGTLSATSTGMLFDGDIKVDDVYNNQAGYGITLGRGAAGPFSTMVGSAAQRTGTGDYNTGLGHGVLELSTGNFNTAVGMASLGATTTGAENTAVGSTSLVSNTSGQQNVAIGRTTLGSNTVGSYNTAVGWGANRIMGSGVYNTCIGFGSGLNLSGSGMYNVTIGPEAGPASYTDGVSYKLYINHAASNTPLIGGDFNTGVVTINKVMSMVTQSSAPTVVNGGLFVSSSGKLFFGSASAWYQLF